MPAVTVAVMVIVDDAPPASEAIRDSCGALPDPPQTPPAVATQVANVTPAGSGSVTVTERAGSVAVLVTVSV